MNSCNEILFSFIAAKMTAFIKYQESRWKVACIPQADIKSVEVDRALTVSLQVAVITVRPSLATVTISHLFQAMARSVALKLIATVAAVIMAEEIRMVVRTSSINPNALYSSYEQSTNATSN